MITLFQFKKISEEINFKKIYIIFIALGMSLFMLKNIDRINKVSRIENKNYWPRIYFVKNSKIDHNYKKIYNEKKFLYYLNSNSDGLCMYNFSPCTNYINKNINKKTIFSYEIYYIDKKL